LGFQLLNEGIFGEGFDINPITYSNSWFSFNPVTETWAPFPALPAGLRSYGTAISNEFSAIVCAGMDENSSFKNDCFYIDHTKKWKPLSALPPAGLKGAKGFALNGSFYLGTGLNDNLVRISDFYQFSPQLATAQESLLFPNPSKDYFNLMTEAGAKISIFSVGGQLIKQLEANDFGFLEITNLPIGLYVCLIEGKNSSEIKKIAKI
jgi:N-acetylneuraminic acid mutarotase